MQVSAHIRIVIRQASPSVVVLAPLDIPKMVHTLVQLEALQLYLRVAIGPKETLRQAAQRLHQSTGRCMSLIPSDHTLPTRCATAIAAYRRRTVFDNVPAVNPLSILSIVLISTFPTPHLLLILSTKTLVSYSLSLFESILLPTHAFFAL